jgi:hypothetical protein
MMQSAVLPGVRIKPEKLIDNHVDFAIAAALRAPDRLNFGPPFPPLARRWALTWWLTNAACFGGSEGDATASKFFCRIPRSVQRAKRL